MKCNCHPYSPFHWKRDPRPSIFAEDPAFRPKKTQVYENLTKEENLIAYKHPKIKPTLNKHELGGRTK